MKTFIVGVVLGYILYKSRDLLSEMRVVYKTSSARQRAYDMPLSQERQDKVEAARLAHIARIAMVKTLREGGSSNLEIAQLLGISESSVRQILPKEEV